MREDAGGNGVIKLATEALEARQAATCKECLPTEISENVIPEEVSPTKREKKPKRNKPAIQ